MKEHGGLPHDLDDFDCILRRMVNASLLVVMPKHT